MPKSVIEIFIWFAKLVWKVRIFFSFGSRSLLINLSDKAGGTFALLMDQQSEQLLS